jgi:hypothetical protein
MEYWTQYVIDSYKLVLYFLIIEPWFEKKKYILVLLALSLIMIREVSHKKI